MACPKKARKKRRPYPRSPPPLISLSPRLFPCPSAASPAGCASHVEACGCLRSNGSCSVVSRVGRSVSSTSDSTRPRARLHTRCYAPSRRYSTSTTRGLLHRRVVGRRIRCMSSSGISTRWSRVCASRTWAAATHVSLEMSSRPASIRSTSSRETRVSWNVIYVVPRCQLAPSMSSFIVSR